ncbi:UDP-N-acetylmuramoyl-L-alanyl-D-glutamate--2,6-diaminopimelate ligase [Polaribacter pacificus]|uniref:UDP-N-acetylmuramoyl-L-alanyl-D-glutamate--2,6-diaminopimelate ligase n=1 Tax=Polaribacter pacificus TaxID=1775173 RepID=A0A917MF58_9FLAO|nr:UDP-N-acetylmuramoyl-L-alanyl-D-glutamate--2,6-diaminopimelate ligase [Polaribacter pacificus]GGG95620.1 UDP-N-acetylmuramoyl-L-alanyl-D-glutamate--2,6-diaminopimelate ligase [Polaribacter pacificus]
MKNLKDILYKIPLEEVLGTTDRNIHQVVFDSRKVVQDDLFVAIKGTLSDGHLFIEKAIDLGATAVVCEELPKEINPKISYIQVKDSHSALAVLASNYYENPSSKLQLIGVTGTNGKTTIATLLYQLFQKAGYKVGLLSTVKVLVDDKAYKTTHTTPDSMTINGYLDQMVQTGVRYCFMEVSSHGIDQKRTHGLQFFGGIFTNLSHDHLDYHKTFLAYRDVKKAFFDELPSTAFALVNLDDKNGAVMLQNTKAIKKTYALKTIADFKAKILEKSMSGSLLSIGGTEVWTRLIGTFNVYNLLAIVGAAELCGLEKMEVLRLLSELESVSGRFQYLIKNDVTAIVDYAHTPDALKNVLETIGGIRTGKEQVFTVVGCGGDRDKTKRPKMALIASQLSDQVILTSDNPRTEDPQVILNEMERGVSEDLLFKTLSILDRKQAIKTACKLAKKGDIILIAGKGHENYQEINGERLHFDDFEIVSECLTQQQA